MLSEIYNRIECNKKYKSIVLIYHRRNTHLTIKLRVTLISYVLKFSLGINIPTKKMPLSNITTTTTIITITTTAIITTTSTMIIIIITKLVIVIHLAKTR